MKPAKHAPRLPRGTWHALAALFLVGAPAIARAGDGAASADVRPDVGAGDDARCRQLRAEAASRAALLYAPTLSAEVLRLPQRGDDTGTGVFQGTGMQLRGVLSHSLVDLWRGLTVERAADASCAELQATSRVRRALEGAVEGAQRDATRARLTTLEAALPRLDEIAARAEARLSAQRATIAETDRVLSRVSSFRRRILRDRARLAELGPDQGSPEPVDPSILHAALHDLRLAAAEEAAQSARLRRLGAWDLRVRGGIIPEDPPDWYGGVELRLNLGAMVQGPAEAQAEAARREALEAQRDGLVAKVDALEDRLQEAARVVRAERALLAEERARARRRLDALEANELLPEALLARDMTIVELAELDAEDAYLRTLAEHYRPFETTRGTSDR